MVNYSMEYGVSLVASILKVEKDLIKKWAYLFSEYLTPGANPGKGMPRNFSRNDINVFASILLSWEDDPDIEAIKYGLNTNDYTEYPFDELLIQITPLFQDPPDNVEEYRHKGVLFGGMSEYSDLFILAKSYKSAGDRLVDIALADEECHDLICPIIYNYRHSAELFLKATLGNSEKIHDLLSLLEKFKRYIKDEFDASAPAWFENILLTFNDFDPYGTTFRYGGKLNRDEIYIDLAHVKTLMNWLAESFQKINDRKMKD